ncbi:MAG: hypothetical protein JXA11_03215 [Phycisphaerae bacterium]|nr:hypothetical protein [Phycisphaerae bacterium]
MKQYCFSVVLVLLTTAFLNTPVKAEELTVSPMICGANSMFQMAGLYYGTLPTSDPKSRRDEFKKILQKMNIRTLRFPGGTDANSKFLADHPDVMGSVLRVDGIPEGGPDKFTDLWQFLDFCKEADITPVFQVNMLLYTDGEKVFKFVDVPRPGEGDSEPSPCVPDVSKRTDAAKALTELVKKMKEKGYSLKHWELGNEEYGYPRMKAADYADLARRFLRAIRKADPEAMIWVTLGSNHCDDWAKKNILPWSEEVLQRLKDAGFTKDKNLGFTLHYVWPGYYIDIHADMVKKYGFAPRFAVTEFHMAGLGDYSDLCPRYGYALELAPYLIGMAKDPRVEILDIHELTSQNFGIIHYNQRSFGPPGMETWDATLGYQLMPAAYVYELFGQLIGGKILNVDSRDNTQLVVEKEDRRLIFIVNRTVNPVTLQWNRDVVGADTKRYEWQSMIPTTQKPGDKDAARALGRSAYPADPLRAEYVTRETTTGVMGKKGLSLTLPSYSINLIHCLPETP